jgi:hypothetical protein
MLGPYASFGGIPTLQSALSRETLDRGPRVVYPSETLRTAVDLWDFIPLFFG